MSESTESRSEPEQPVTTAPTSLLARGLALLALLALVASAVWSSWAILTDRADFGAPPSDSPPAREGSAQR